MKIEAFRTVKEKVEIEVDDRIYDNDTVIWQMANLFLNDGLDRIVSRDLYSDDFDHANYAAQRINEAFKFADKALALVKEGKFEL